MIYFVLYFFSEFLKAMNEGSGKLTQMNIILHGPPGAGKTSLKQIILGQSPLPLSKRNSSNVLENPVRAVAIDRANGFKEVSNEDLIRIFAETLIDQIQQQPNASAPVVAKQKEKKRSWLSSLNPWKSKQSVNSPAAKSDVSDTAINMDEVNYLRLIYDELVFADSYTSTIFNSTWHHVIDSGGQPQFQDMIPLVYRSPSFQIILMRLTEGLDDKPLMQYTIEGQNAIESPKDIPLTNQQYIERACQIASSCDPPSKVMIVGTHRDKLGHDCESVIADLNKALITNICEHYPKVVICKSKRKGHVIFDMNTMATGEERQSNIKDLQEAINEVSNLLAKSQIVCLKWLSFHLAINKDKGVIGFEDCVRLGNALGMDKDSVTKALKYFSETGLLLYYPDAVPEIVLTKVDPLVERLSMLIKASLLPPKGRTLEDQFEELSMRGTFNKVFFNQLFPIDPQAALNNNELLNMLICLKLAIEIGNDEYFLPSALSYYSSQCSTPDLLSCGFALTLKGEKRILPHGFFFTTVIQLQNDSNGFRFEFRTNDQQYRDRIQVIDKSRKISGVMILSDKKWWIQITMTSKSSAQYRNEIRQAVIEAIKRTVPLFKHLGIHNCDETQEHLALVYPCPIEGHSDHYCTLTTNQKEYICSADVSCAGEVTNNIKSWIGSKYTRIHVHYG